MDTAVIVEAFVVVVIGGMGSVWGALLASLLIGVLNAFGILMLPRVSIVLIFVVMAAVLIVRPWGLLGRPEAAARGRRAERPTSAAPARRPPDRAGRAPGRAGRGARRAAHLLQGSSWRCSPSRCSPRACIS